MDGSCRAARKAQHLGWQLLRNTLQAGQRRGGVGVHRLHTLLLQGALNVSRLRERR